MSFLLTYKTVQNYGERRAMHKRSSRRLLLRAGASCFSIFFAAIGAAQQLIENPAKPPSARAGRVVSLKEVARITDEKGKFIFVQPLAVFVGNDGSVYVQESRQLLKFDAQGRFVKNLLKRGQGPGELDDNLTDVVLREKDIILWSSNNYKFIRLDLDGRLIEDKKLVQGFLGSLLGAFGGRCFFLRYEMDMAKSRPRVSGILEALRRLVIVPDNGEAVPTPVLMPMTEAVHIGPRSASVSTISRAMPVAAGEGEVFLFHTPDYLIKLLDLGTGEVVRSFRREYDRVKYEVKTPSGYPAELMPKFHNDLCRLLWRDDRLWAVTSTFDPKKGILVDVFSREGKYLDNFFLPLFKIRRDNPQYYAPMAIWRNFLYLLEADEDDIISLIKYEIGEE